MEYLEIKNWRFYQRYKANRPAWIKWYRDITIDLDWLQMDDPGKLLLPYMLLVAAETENRFPNDPGLIASRLRLKKPFVEKGMSTLLNSGFLQIVQENAEAAMSLHPIEEKRRDREEKRREEGAELPAALNLTSFKKVWAEWLEYRRAHRWTVKIPWQEKQLNMLAEAGPTEAIAALETSMANGWQGVFPKGTAGKRPRQGLISEKYRRDK